MELLATRGERQIWLDVLARPYRLAAPFSGETYVCILFANDQAITGAEQVAVSEQLVRTGCRYAVCAGHRCSTWDDSVDLAYLATDKDSPTEDTFVTTSWHEHDAVEDVIFYGLMCTGDLTRYLVLFVGPRAGLRAEVKKGIQAVWHSEQTAPDLGRF